MSKKMLSMLLCSVFIFSMLSGCSNNSNNQSSSSATDSNQTSTSSSQTSTTPASSSPAASTQSSAPAGERKVKDTIIAVNELEPDTLDPRRGNSVSNNIVMNLIYDSLIEQDDDFNNQPRLATEWEFIDDTHLRFKLRDDVVFSNGNPFTAEDVLFSLARTKLDSTSQSLMTWYDDENSYAEDDYSVVLAMHHAHAPVFNTLAGGRTWIGDKETIEEMGEEAHARMPVGSGPYKVKEWVSGSSILLERNDKYWADAAKTQYFNLKFVSEPTSRVIEMETGAVDLAYYVAAGDIDRVNNINGYHVERGASEKYYLITLAMNNEKFQDERVRYALSYAIDIEGLADGAFDGTAHPMTGVYPSIVEGWKDLGGWEYNPEKAKELLKEAGAENLSFELHILPGTDYQRMAEIVQAYWQSVGVTVNIEQSALATREAQGPWDASIRTATANEISNILIIYEKAFASRISSNDEFLESQLALLKKTYAGPERTQLLHDLQDYIYKIRFTIPFAEVDTIIGVSDKIENYKFTQRIPYQNIVDWVVYE